MRAMTGFDLDTWIALRRVSAGRVTKRGQRWLESGHPVPDLSASLVTLCQRGLVTLAERSPLGRAAALTRTGVAHYDLLCQRALGLSAARFDASCRWFGLDDPPEAAPTTPVSTLVAGGATIAHPKENIHDELTIRRQHWPSPLARRRGHPHFLARSGRAGRRG